MKKPSEFNDLSQKLSGITLPTIDVSSPVMGRIRVMYNEQTVPVKARLPVKRHPKVMWITVFSLFFVFIATVSASVVPVSWNGESFTIEDDGGRNARIDAFKEFIFGKEPTYKESVEDVLNNHKNAKEVMSLDEAKQQFPFTILRPDPSKAQPIRSNGVLMNEMLQENGKDVRIIGYRPVFHDIYALDNQRWVIVTQNLDQAATDHLKGKVDSISSTYIGNWENVQINNQMIAMYSESKKKNTLLIKYKTEQSQVIDIEIVGTGTKEQLIKLAEAYTGL
ncbi:hypothetical protein J2Z22_000831 [Paenibacillus forsythiae]|uniref:DUF4367 domain-containing protein n=1 Tax=Paenibacillus forsythiae TaxID=365616 RepID=A0ABU3H3J5_9BACL|nr:hypothetical protein [Paenibacillus forsythiae]MDT3425315.1 hypothetical protein [Paenibacillus forsythiae]